MKLMPTVNNILMVRRHQVITLPFIRHTLVGIAVDILTPVRGIQLIHQYDSKEIIYGILVENAQQSPKEWQTMLMISQVEKQ
jgi:hypothetical protein